MTHIAYGEYKFTAKRERIIYLASQIIDDYEGQGYTLTLRQLYYQMVSRNIIPNVDKEYKNLGNAINDARMAGLISWTSIEDRGRGINPWLIEEDEQNVLHEIERNFALDYWRRQDTYVEVWVEKDALSAVLERPCGRWRVPYMPCKGYLSASEAWRSGQRFAEASDRGARCVLIHLGDHDPSGIDMTRDNAARLETFTWGADIDVRRIALNMDQVEHYRPPPNPAKMTDTRAADYVNRYGRTSWELDALEPRVLDALIEDEIKSLVDMDLWNATAREERQRRSTLAMLHDRWFDVKAYLEDGEDDQG